ncbi:Ribosomal protein S24/S35, mitochondrial [Prunus dulcis]|uniref:Ribosomal protein S24/S35, mitochondrial n=1 Tax=Prunus dulcis TaxID=3755 RepID=A0A4Y1RJQ3_PRUDU|nr:Ribosomal protein S24/S35, mitochondrial [Prunus dulcis]
MKRLQLRNLCLYARTRLLSPSCYNPGSQLAPLAASTRPRLRFYSTESSSHNQEEDVSDEELKMQIDKYFRGDEEAIPSIFEAILKRKLTGKHEEDDKMLMEEIPGKRQEEPLSDIDDEQETKSDFDEGSDSDG